MKKVILIIAVFVLTACAQPAERIELTEATSNNEDPSIIEVDGKYYMTWFSTSSGFADIWIVEGSKNGWSQPRQVTEGEEQDFYPTLAYDNGMFHMSFFRIDPETKVSNVWYAKSEDGVTWEEEQVTNSNATDWTPRVMAENGTVYIVWTSNRSGNRDIFIAKNTGEGWSTPQQLTNSELEEDFPYLAFIDDEYYLIWSQFEQSQEHPFGGEGSRIVLSKADNPLIWPSYDVISDERKEASDTLPMLYQNEGITYALWTSGYRNEEGDIIRKRLGSPFYEYITDNPYPDYSGSAVNDVIVWSSDPDQDEKNKIINFKPLP